MDIQRASLWSANKAGADAPEFVQDLALTLTRSHEDLIRLPAVMSEWCTQANGAP
jgi:hypothetical protein